MLIRSTLWYFGAHVASGAISLISIAVFTRVLSPTDFGQYGVVLAISGIANGFAFEWLRRGYLRLAPASTEQARNSQFAAVSALALAVSGLGAVAAAIWTLADLDPFGVTANIVWFIIALVAGRALYELFLAHLRARFAVRSYSATVLTRSALTLGLGAGLGLELGVTGLLVGVLTGWLLPSIFLFCAGIRSGWVSVTTVEKDRIVEIMRLSYPLIFVAGLDMSMQFSDRLLLSSLLGAVPTGFYTAATDLIRNSLVFLMMVVGVAAFPVLMRRYDLEGSEAGATQLADNLVLLAGIAVPAAIALLVVRHEITPIMVAEAYREAVLRALPLVILVALMFGFKAFYLDDVFHLAKRQRDMVLPGVLGLAVNLAVGFVAIREVGMIGAVYGSGAGYLAAMAVSWHRAKRLISLRIPVVDLSKVLLSAGLMGLVMSLIDLGAVVPTLLAKAGVGIFAYATAILLLNPRAIRQTAFAARP